MKPPMALKTNKMEAKSAAVEYAVKQYKGRSSQNSEKLKGKEKEGKAQAAGPVIKIIKSEDNAANAAKRPARPVQAPTMQAGSVRAVFQPKPAAKPAALQKNARNEPNTVEQKSAGSKNSDVEVVRIKKHPIKGIVDKVRNYLK
jgi:hypothetical protein